MKTLTLTRSNNEANNEAISQMEAIGNALLASIAAGTEKQDNYVLLLIDEILTAAVVGKNMASIIATRRVEAIAQMLIAATQENLTAGQAITVFKTFPLNVADYQAEKDLAIKQGRWGK